MKHEEIIGTFLKGFLDIEQLVSQLEDQHFQYYSLLLTPFSFASIDEGLKILKKIQEKLVVLKKFKDESNFEDFCLTFDQISDLNNKYLKAVPQIFDKKIEMIKDIYEIKRAYQTLKSLMSLSTATRLTLAASLSQSKLNPYDYIFDSLPINLRFLAEDSEDYRVLLAYLNSGDNSSYAVCKCIAEVSDSSHSKADELKFEKMDNHMLLVLAVDKFNLMSMLATDFSILPFMTQNCDSEILFDGYYFQDSTKNVLADKEGDTYIVF